MKFRSALRYTFVEETQLDLVSKIDCVDSRDVGQSHFSLDEGEILRVPLTTRFSVRSSIAEYEEGVHQDLSYDR